MQLFVSWPKPDTPALCKRFSRFRKPWLSWLYGKFKKHTGIPVVVNGFSFYNKRFILIYFRNITAIFLFNCSHNHNLTRINRQRKQVDITLAEIGTTCTWVFLCRLLSNQLQILNDFDLRKFWEIETTRIMAIRDKQIYVWAHNQDNFLLLQADLQTANCPTLSDRLQSSNRPFRMK